MNTLNEFELNRMKKFYTQELANRLQRSKSTKLANYNQQQQARLPNTCYWQTSGGRAARATTTTTTTTATADLVSHPASHAPLSASRPFLRSGGLHDCEPELEMGAGVDLKRYQHALSFKQRRARHHQAHRPKRFGRALYDFAAKSEAQLSLSRGDLVELLEVSEDDRWARVEDSQSGLQGLVPLAYLDCNIGCALAKRDVAARSRSSSQLSNGVVSPHYDDSFAQLADQLLPMTKGEPIALIRRLSGHLYEANNTRQVSGLVWSNDLEIIKQPNEPAQAWDDLPGPQRHGDPAPRRSRFHQTNNGELAMDHQEDAEEAQSQAYGRHDDAHERAHDENDDDDDDDDEDDDEIAQYLDQLRSICTDLETSRQRHAPGMQEVPLLDSASSLAKRRRARSASSGLSDRHEKESQQQQQQKHQRQWRDSEAHRPSDGDQFYRHSTFQRHQMEKRVEETHFSLVKRVVPILDESQHYCATCCDEQRRKQQHQWQHQHQHQQHQQHQQHRHHHHNQQPPRACAEHEPIAWRQPVRSSSSPQIDTATERLEIECAGSLPRLCRARYAYKPRQRDELELVPGDVLVVVQVCDDGWFIGSSYTTKQMGTFPGNFVEPI